MSKYFHVKISKVNFPGYGNVDLTKLSDDKLKKIYDEFKTCYLIPKDLDPVNDEQESAKELKTKKIKNDD